MRFFFALLTAIFLIAQPVEAMAPDNISGAACLDVQGVSSSPNDGIPRAANPANFDDSLELVPTESNAFTLVVDATIHGQSCIVTVQNEQTLTFGGVIGWQEPSRQFPLGGSYIAVRLFPGTGQSFHGIQDLTVTCNTGNAAQRTIIQGNSTELFCCLRVEQAGDVFTLNIAEQKFKLYIAANVTFAHGASFDLNNGITLPARSAQSNGKLPLPTPPTREGYTFAGWYLDAACTEKFSEDTIVRSALTLYADWLVRDDMKPDNTDSSYRDLTVNGHRHWAAADILAASAMGIVSGYPDGTFRPNNPMTRAEFVKVLATLDKANVRPYNQADTPFTDLISQWYRPYVAWAYQKNLVFGRSATTFEPNGEISRQEMATMIARYLDARNAELPADNRAAAAFSDTNQIAFYAQNAVEKLRRGGIIFGKSENFFLPKDTTTRAEVVTVVARLIRKL